MKSLIRMRRKCRQQETVIWFLRYQTLQILLLQALLVSPVERSTKDAAIVVNSVVLTRGFVLMHNSMPLSTQVPTQPGDIETNSATATAPDTTYSDGSLCLNIFKQSVVNTASDVDDPDAHTVDFPREPFFDDKGKLEESELEFMEIKPQRGEDATRSSCCNDSSTKEASPAHIDSEQTIRQRADVVTDIDSEQTIRQRADVVTCASTAERDQLFVRFSTQSDTISEKIRSRDASNSSRYHSKVAGFLSINSSKSSGPNKLAKEVLHFDVTTIKSTGSKRLGENISSSRAKDTTSTIEKMTKMQYFSSTNMTSFERMSTDLYSIDTRNMATIERVAAGSSSVGTLRKSLSCEQRCGEDTNYPCSCDEKCVVYKTCCEDLTETCPGLYNLALAKFGHLLSASIHCDAISAVLLVQSCPSKAENIHSFKEDLKTLKKSTTPTTSYDQYASKDEQGRVFSLLDILSNAPFTVYDTGIIYANASIYKCNKENTFISNQTLGSQAVSWMTQIGANNIDFHRELNDIQKELDLSTYSYLPPKSHPTSAGTLCYSNWTLSCISQLSRELNISQLTCDTGVNEYYSLRNVLRTMPLPDRSSAHLICALCLSDAQRLSAVSNRFYVSGLKILMSLSEASGKVEYSVHKEWLYPSQPIPWLLWTCNISDQSTHQAGRLWKAQHCDQLYLITSDGDCRKAVEAELFIREKILFNGRKCKIDPTAFAEVSKYYLEKLYKLKATTKPFRTYRSYKKSWDENLNAIKTNIRLTSIRMEMYFDTERFENEVMGLKRNFLKMKTAILIFAQRYCSMQGEWEEGKGVSLQDDSQTVHKKSEIDDVNATQYADISFISSADLDINEILDNSLINMCLQFDPIDSNLSDTIKCDYISDFYDRNPHIDTNGLLATDDDLKCFKDAIYMSTSAMLLSPRSPLPWCLINVTLVILWWRP